jgi:hypothetical protein
LIFQSTESSGEEFRLFAFFCFARKISFETRRDYGQKSIVDGLENHQRRFRLVLSVFDYRRVDTDSLFQKHGETLLLHRHDVFYSAPDLSDGRLRLEFGEKVKTVDNYNLFKNLAF